MCRVSYSLIEPSRVRASLEKFFQRARRKPPQPRRACLLAVGLMDSHQKPAWIAIALSLILRSCTSFTLCAIIRSSAPLAIHYNGSKYSA